MEYYSTPGQRLLWVDANGLTSRGKAVVAEITKADDYGLRASDYALPNMAGFDAGNASATEQLANAELKISHAAIDYTYDARGGRITPTRLSKNLDPTLELPKPLEVIEAIRQFQAEHNSYADGVVGPGTRQLLNTPHRRNMGSPAQIKAILLNMERWRWLPRDQGSFYVTVNIPEFTLRVVEEDEVVHTARVVVGKTNKQTPVFSNEMKTVVFGPYWNVPTSIKVGEIRPYVRPAGGGWFGGGRAWNTSVFQRHDLRIKYGGREVDPASLDWNRVDIRNLHLYQPPGPRNVLGKVKFVFPNKHDVYMHDTPQKHLFAKPVRAESHGCMRVQNPDQLAGVILRHDQNWSRARTVSALETGYNQHVRLRQKVPVHITYFTLRVNEDGSVTTFGDLYGHDGRMAAALF